MYLSVCSKSLVRVKTTEGDNLRQDVMAGGERETLESRFSGCCNRSEKPCACCPINHGFRYYNMARELSSSEIARTAMQIKARTVPWPFPRQASPHDFSH